MCRKGGVVDKDFLSIVKSEQHRRAARVQELAARLTVPVPPELLAQITSLGPGDQSKLLRRHPGHKIQRLLDSLWSMADVFERAKSDLVMQLSAFDVFSRSSAMHRPDGQTDLREIQSCVNKELVAFAAAALSLVDFSRQLSKQIDVPGFDSRRREIFDEEEHRFVTGLRNFMLHQTFPQVGWRITRDAINREGRSDFTIREDSFDQGDLNVHARTFIKRGGSGGVSVRELVASYSKRVQAFYDWYRVEVQAHLPRELLDYQRILLACRANSARVAYRMLLQQGLQRSVNPYQHLDKFLTRAQRREALELPMRSKAQVDFIISAADQHGACDDELRSMLYRLFEVE